MARKRMIDPSMWINEDFGTLSILSKLVFIGLFSNADDEGRGKASPAYIKAVLFPYNDDLRIADIEKALLEISSKMSVIFYSCDENKYYTLTSWNTFQKIDKPSESKIPDYDEANSNIRRIFVEGSSKVRRPVPPKRKEDNKKEIEEKRIEVKEIYNSVCTNLPQVQKLTDKRNKAIDNFLKEFTKEQFQEMCKKANDSDFLIGKNDKHWKADFDFFMRIDKATNTLEGKYDNEFKVENNKKEFQNYEQRKYDNLYNLYANKQIEGGN